MKGLLLAVGLAAGITLVGTKYLIEWLTRHRIGQPIRDDGPDGHKVKAGTPTMGGAAMVVGSVVAYLVAHVLPGVYYTRTGIFVMGAIVGAGVVGLLDDGIKVTRERNLGLNKRAKVLGLLAVAFAFAIAMVQFTEVETEIGFTRHGNLGIDIGPVAWVLWAVLLILGTSNAVNLTDGLDGLAAGSASFTFSAYTVIAFWAFRNADIYRLDHALDLAVIAVAMLGACIGFLWWNAAPAQIFMGDTGSLAIGTGIACLALATNTELLLPILGGLFVVETLSVITQVASFRLFGRRLFRMAPIHHHFELLGWPETTVIIRFWLIAGFLTAVGLGIFYTDYLDVVDLLQVGASGLGTP